MGVKIKTWVDLGSQEVPVEVTAEEILVAFTSNEDGYSEEVWLKRVASNVVVFFRKVPDSVIAGLTPEVKKIIADAFEEQAKRFRA